MNQLPDVSVDQGEVEIAMLHEVRHRISESFGHDPYRLVAHLMELQKQHPERVLAAPSAEFVSAVTAE